jgi:hypothetical protein
LILVVLACLLAGPALGDEVTEQLLKNTGWGRFKPGAWQQVRIVVESLDPQGNVTGTTNTDRTTTLVGVDPQSVTLELAVTAEVAGKRLDAPIQFITQGCHGEPSGQATEVRELTPTPSTIEGKTIVCRVREYQISDQDQRRRIVVYYNRDFEPMLLRRRSEARSKDGDRQIIETSVDVISLNTPHKVKDQVLPASVVRTVQKTDTTKISMTSVLVSDVPGGVVSSKSEERDGEGRIVRRTTLELVDWGQEDEDWEQRSPERRREHRRQRRQSR